MSRCGWRVARSAGFAGLAGVVLAACAVTTPYQPLQKGYGYYEQQLEPDRYQIHFVGSSATSRQTVENYLLYRAAELTLTTGHDYFVVIGQGTQGSAKSGSGVSLGIGGFGGGSHAGLGIGIGTRAGGDGTEYHAQADIRVYSGTRPADRVDAYDARAVKASLEAQIRRP